MNLRIGFIACLALVLSALCGSASATDPCLSPSQCRTINVQRPIRWDGMPAGPICWLGGTGSPRAWEDDPQHDDDMGSAHVQPDGSASYQICANGDILVDENGEYQNGTGTLEGSCIEVQICFTYIEVVTMTVTTTVSSSSNYQYLGSGSSSGSSGSSTSVATTSQVRVFKKVCAPNPAQEVCAC